MNYGNASDSCLPVSRLALGCEPLGGTDWGYVNIELVMAAIGRALELGINFFDTANVYGLGLSEERLSTALGPRRHDVVIATKGGVNWVPEPQGRATTYLDSSPKHLVEAVEASLQRLRIDTIPLYFIHWPDPKTPIAETMDALARCKEQGKIRAVGLSNFSPAQVRQAAQYMKIAAVQLQYNLIDRSAEAELLACCRELDIRVIAYGVLAQGLLTGKYTSPAVFEQNDRRHRLRHFQSEVIQEKMRLVDRLKLVSVKYDKTPAQTAIRWVLDNPDVHFALAGAKSPTQIEHNVGALEWHLTPADYRFLSVGTDEQERGA